MAYVSNTTKAIMGNMAKKALICELKDQWKVIGKLEKALNDKMRDRIDIQASYVDYAATCTMDDNEWALLTAYNHEMAYSSISIMSAREELALAEDKYNEIAITLEDWYAPLTESDNEMVDEDDDYYVDVECVVKPRYTKRDILSPAEAIKTGKASKLHKLKMPKPSRDMTKTPDAKKRTAAMKYVRG